MEPPPYPSSRQMLLLHGDQTDNMVPTIRKLYREARFSPLLERFLTGCSRALRVQVSGLNTVDRRGIPAFDSVLDLAERHDKSDGSSAFITLLLCYVARLGNLILHAEQDPEFFTVPTTILSLCVGAIPAIIGAAARSASDIVELGVGFLPACVKLGVASIQRDRMVEDSEDGCWGYVIKQLPSEEIQKAINEFHKMHQTPTHQQIFISVLGQEWCTVMGPPKSLSPFLKFSQIVSNYPMIPFPIRGLAHVSHLPPLDLEGCIRNLTMLDRPISEHLTIMSTSTCTPYPGRTLRAVLLEGMRDASERPLRLGDTITAVMEHVSRRSGQVHVVTAGPSLQARGIEQTLASCGLDCHMVSLEPRTETPPFVSDRIAIVGMAGRFPQSDSIHEFWDLVLKGVDAHTEIPQDRFPLQDWFDATGEAKNSTSARHGCFINDPGKFDTRLFNVSPREALQMDPVQRLLLMTTHEALDDAGFNNSSASLPDVEDRPKVGVYVGQCTEQWRDICVKHGVDIFSITGLLRTFAPGRLNYHFKFEGPSYSLDAACSSSSTAIGLACSALQDGSIDMAVAGGAQLSNTPLEFSGLSKAGFLSTTGGCKTFRSDADGYCRGEGVGMIVLKRLEDALRDNDNIHSVISGWARNHSANAISITHPHAETQQRLYNRVLQQAGMSSSDVGYVEMHGTGTQAGDSCEMSSVTSVFAQRRTKKNPLYVGAVKANVGHSEAAAGVTAVIKASFMLKFGIIPPQVGMPGELNPAFPDLANMNVHIASKRLPFPGQRRSVLVNNFDAAGGNTCLMLKEAPSRTEKASDPRDWHVVACSGRTPAALRGNKRRLLAFLANASEPLALADVAYSTTARRTHEMLRSGYVGSSVSHIMQQLRSDLQSSEKNFEKIPPKTATVFLFTGQGSHYAGMGAELYKFSNRFRGKMDSFVDMARTLGLPSFVEIIADENVDLESKTTAQVQLATVCLELALADLWMSWGVTPSVLMGHSLGEYAALCVAGVLSPADALFIVGTRATLIQDRLVEGEFAMLSIVGSADLIQKHLAVSGYGRTCQISCYNSAKSTVISGKAEDLERLQEFMEGKGVRTKFLQVPYGFHSPQLDSVLGDLEVLAKSLQFSAPKIPIMSTMTGQIVLAGDENAFNAAYMTRQARDPVRFVDALENLMAQRELPASRHNLWLEIGPSPVCVGFVRSTLDVSVDRSLASLKAGESVHKTVSSTLSHAYQSGVQVDWRVFHKDCMDLGSVQLLDGMPTYSFDTKDYWSVYEMETSPVFGSLPPHQASRRQSGTNPEPARPCFKSTSSLQRIKREVITSDEISVTFESDTADEKLSQAIRGHLVSGAALCPTSVFSDMAAGAAKYVWDLTCFSLATKDSNRNGRMLALSIQDLDIFSPLVLAPVTDSRKAQRLIRVHVTTTTKPEKLGGLRVTFSSSGDSSGLQFQENGRCNITWGDAQALKMAWSKNSHLVKARMDAMMSPQKSDTMVRLQRRFVYRLFNSIVRYDEKYQGLHEVFMDEDMQDAVAVVKLTSRDALTSSGNWTVSPYWSDAIVHLAGFVMNGSSRNQENTAHISAGLDRMTLTDELSDKKTYYSYVRMRAGEKKGSSIGDVYLLDGETIIAFAEGVKFQQLPINILNAVLGIGYTSTSSRAPSVHSTPILTETSPHAPAAIVDPTPRQVSGCASVYVQRDESDRRDSGVSLSHTTPTKTSSSPSLSLASSRSSPPSCFSNEKIYNDDNSKIMGALLEAVIAETGFDVADMDDTTEFSDMGVDSLMSIAIIDSVKRRTGIALPVSLFLEMRTVGDFRAKFASDNRQSPNTPSERKVSVHFPEAALQESVMRSARESSRRSSRRSLHMLSPRTKDLEEVGMPSPPNLDCYDQYDCQESPPSRIIQEEGRSALTGVFQTTHFRRGSTPPAMEDHAQERPFVLDPNNYSSNVVLMQGDSRSTKTPLILICDGAGSAAAYVNMPQLPSGTPVYALESPFLRCPLDFNCSLEQVALLYKAAIKKMWPSGPYLIGGWSAGAVYAYEVCRQLLATGEEEGEEGQGQDQGQDQVQGLILIDMKVPRPNLSIAPPTMDAVGQANLVTHVHGERAILDAPTKEALLSQATKEHLLASALCVRKYEPRPLRTRPMGGTYLIWARWGLCDTLRNASDIEDIGRGLPADPAGKNVMFDNDLDMRTFLFSRRRVFGTNGWEKLVGVEGLETAVIDGDHFSIVRKPHVTALAENIQKALDKFSMA